MDKFHKITKTHEKKKSLRNEEGLLHCTLLTPSETKSKTANQPGRMEHTKKGCSIVAGRQ